MAKTPEMLGEERARRISDAMQLKQPDRIPLVMSIGYMLAEMGGITKQELLEDPDNTQRLLEKAALQFEPDSIHGPMPADPSRIPMMEPTVAPLQSVSNAGCTALHIDLPKSSSPHNSATTQMTALEFVWHQWWKFHSSHFA